MLAIAAEGDFDGVARSIADPAPEWLPIALAHFGQWICGDTSDARVFDILDQLQRATKVLEQCLPAFTHMAFNVKCPEAVKMVLSGLPGLKAELERLNQQRIGRMPDAQRQFCAAVIIEAWQCIHGVEAINFIELAANIGRSVAATKSVPPTISKIGAGQLVTL